MSGFLKAAPAETREDRWGKVVTARMSKATTGIANLHCSRGLRFINLMDTGDWGFVCVLLAGRGSQRLRRKHLQQCLPQLRHKLERTIAVYVLRARDLVLSTVLGPRLPSVKELRVINPHDEVWQLRTALFRVHEKWPVEDEMLGYSTWITLRLRFYRGSALIQTEANLLPSDIE